MATFRPATPDDIQAVLAFWQESAEPSSTDNAREPWHVSWTTILAP